jgi:molybdate transport system substrate-binding protein
VTRLRAAALGAAVLSIAAGCGGHGDGARGGHPTVSAAASLKAAFEDYDRSLGSASARFNFGGSDELAAQIRQGAPADVYAAANTSLPRGLFRAGLVERPVVFARNRLVIAVPAGRGPVRTLADLARPGVKLALGAASVPVGSYARRVLARLGAAKRRRILANVRSNEPDVAGVVGKLLQGAAEAGFVYATDVLAARGRLRAIELPRALRPSVRYGGAVVRRARHPTQAAAFIHGLLRGAGRRALRRAGFGPAG